MGIPAFPWLLALEELACFVTISPGATSLRDGFLHRRVYVPALFDPHVVDRLLGERRFNEDNGPV